jgi:LysM repeat protein
MKLVALIIGVSVVFFSQASEIEKQISKKEYAEIWRFIAVQQMVKSRIPASITLAQGILESGSGNSELAKKGNNHFGIKCHDWTGDKMYMDDDTIGECFRVYANAEQSYIDHSNFLLDKKRYNGLFLLDLTDYKGWANGLKEAGYATNPKYSELLINIIDELKLYELDVIGSQNKINAPNISQSNQKNVSQAHAIAKHENNVNYIVARKGDTFYRISKEFGLGLWQLYNYNDFYSQKDILVEGDIVYIQRKRNKSKDKTLKLSKSMSLREVSQDQALRLESLLKYNQSITPDLILSKGENVSLR